jgi:hypothetical protein
MAQKQGGKNKKLGRSKRSPSHTMYNSTKRAEFNKVQNVEKEKKRKANKKQMRVPRGTARQAKRAHLQPAQVAA